MEPRPWAHLSFSQTIRIHRDVPPIIFANIGTTMKGACDNLAAIRAVLDEFAITSAYIHADAALSGMILPFVAEPQPWDFADGADSISHLITLPHVTEDKPGALAVVAQRLKDAGLDLRSMHIVRRTANVSIASLVADDNAKAAAVLRDVLIGNQ